MTHKAYIPKEMFSKCKIVKKSNKWVDSELVESETAEEFEGAVFNLSRSDIRMLAEYGVNTVLDMKKIYCYRDIDLKETVEFQGNQYTVTTERNYMNHDQLRIYYIERIKN